MPPTHPLMDIDRMVKKITTVPTLLNIILERIRRLETYTCGVSVNDYLDNVILQDACERCLEIIGDSCNEIQRKGKNENIRFSDTTLEEFSDAYGFRNTMAHGYDDINNRTVFAVIRNDLPKFKEMVLKVKENVG